LSLDCILRSSSTSLSVKKPGAMTDTDNLEVFGNSTYDFSDDLGFDVSGNSALDLGFQSAQPFNLSSSSTVDIEHYVATDVDGLRDLFNFMEMLPESVDPVPLHVDVAGPDNAHETT